MATAREDVANVACPELSVPLPRIVAPSLKVTDPVGVPLSLAATVAVNVTDWPNTDGFVFETTEVVVLA